MSAFRAVALMDARRILIEVACIGLLGMTFPVALARFSADAASSGAALLVSASMSGVAALTLGAGVFGRDAGARFLASRAISPVASLAARLIARGTGLLIVTAACAASANLAGIAAEPELARILRPQDYLPTLALFFLSAALASAFTKSPTLACLAGALTATLLGLVVVVLAAATHLLETGNANRVLVALLIPMLGLTFLLSKRLADAAFDPARALRRAGLIAGLAALAALVAWVTLGTWISGARVERELARWEQAMAGPAGVPAVTRASATTPAAVAFDRLAAESRPTGREKPATAEADAVSWTGTQRALGLRNGSVAAEWLATADLMMADDLAADLAARREHLEAMRHALLSGAIAWADDELAWQDSVLRLRAARLLAAEAVRLAQAGDREGALATLAALRKLTAALRDRPALISRLLALGMSRLHAQAAWRVGVDAAWIDGEDAPGHRKAILDAAILDTRMAVESVMTDPPFPRQWKPTPLGIAGWMLQVPVLRWRIGSELIVTRDTLARPRAVTACQALSDPWAAMADEAAADQGRPVVVNRHVMGLVRRAAMTEAAWECVRVAADLRAWRATAAPGASPPAEMLISRTCPGQAWRLRATEDGALLLEPWFGALSAAERAPIARIVAPAP